MRRSAFLANRSSRAPAGLTRGCEAWLRFDEGVSVDGSNRVLTMPDVSGWGRHFVSPADNARKPVLAAQGIEFNGMMQRLTGPPLPMAGAAPRTFIAVYQPYVPVGTSGSPGQSGYILFTGTEVLGGGFSWQTSRAAASDPYVIVYGYEFATPFPRDNLRRVTEVGYDGVGFRAAVNGSSFYRQEVLADTTPGADTIIGMRPTGGDTVSFRGLFREIAAWSRLLSPEESAAARAEMMARNLVTP